ncbi:uncharacterized protein LOC118751844 [Rhagoletis pomonella]|uniref:uncharacterized protein LOC118751844 n=1 Tax=Rhagoletis pomonella TaxID=28610 RepID=UPI00177F356A|nr:uncharacterized protein LOC118751844 [Rhagoletis pomonella]
MLSGANTGGAGAKQLNVVTPGKSIYCLNLNYSDFIELNCTDSYKLCSFLVDSQADISLIKISSLARNSAINSSNTINITGVTTETVTTLGTMTVLIYLLTAY